MTFKSEVNFIQLFSTLDWLLFFLVALATILSVIIGQRLKSQKDSESDSFIDLMLMGRKLTLPMFVATLVATWYGGIFGTSQIAFENGIFNFVTQGFFWYLTYLIFAFFIVKKIGHTQALTLPDMVGRIFGPKSEKICAIFNLINLIPIAYAISMGLLIQMLFGLSLTISIAVGIIFVLLYSTYGGMRAVVFSDLIQFFVMCTTVILIAIFSYQTFGWQFLVEKLPSHYFHPMGNFSLTQTFVWGLIALSTLVDPNFYQRSFAADSTKTARNGILISTLIWIVFDLSLTAGAMYAKAVIPEANSKYGYFIYSMQLLPDGLRGFALAGIAATILSTLDSYIFLAGSTLAYDLVPKRLKGKVAIHHLGVISVGLFSILMAIIFEGNIRSVWKTLGSLSSSALLIPILYGHLFPKKARDSQFLIAAFFGTIATIVWRLGPFKEETGIDEIYIGCFCSLLGILSTSILGRKQRIRPSMLVP